MVIMHLEIYFQDQEPKVKYSKKNGKLMCTNQFGGKKYQLLCGSCPSKLKNNFD